jgi:hypothetical protein
LAEQQTLNLRVVGSIPTRLTTLHKALNLFFHSADRERGCVWSGRSLDAHGIAA